METATGGGGDSSGTSECVYSSFTAALCCLHFVYLLKSMVNALTGHWHTTELSITTLENPQ